jgi:hypothetical protein
MPSGAARVAFWVTAELTKNCPYFLLQWHPDGTEAHSFEQIWLYIISDFFSPPSLGFYNILK